MPFVTFNQIGSVEVPPDGDPNSKICIVGEAPGSYEERQQKPFVGPSGTVLEQCLHDAGLIRRDVYITNFIKTRIVKSNGIEGYYNKRTHRLTGAGMEARDKLLEELATLKCNIIVPLGAPAAAAVAGCDGILKWRGSLLTTKIGDREVKVIPTIHPAMTLHGSKRVKESIEGKTGTSPYIFKYFISHDLLKARQHSESPDLQVTPRQWIANPDFRTTMRMLDEIEQHPVVSFDIEVVNFEVACIAYSWDIHLGFTVPVHGAWSEEEELRIWKRIGEIHANPNITWVTQNGIFDTWFLMYRMGIVTAGPVHDTMIAHHVMYPDMPKGLDFINSIYTDIPYYKDEGKVYKKPINTINWPRFRLYNAKDAVCTLECWEKFQGELDDGFRWTYDIHRRIWGPLTYIMLRGIRVDRERLKIKSEETLKEITHKQNEFHKTTRPDLNWNSPAQMTAYFYGELGIPPYTKTVHTSRGTEQRMTVDDKALTRLARGTSSRPGVPAAKLVQELRSLSKLHGTYLSIAFDEDGRFRTSCNPRGTTTGRISTSKTVFGTGTNLQNLPEAFRVFLVPDRGYFLVEIDLRQAEWVGAAYMFDDPQMQLVLEQGRDPHTATAAMMCQVPEDFVKMENKLIGHSTDASYIEEIRRTKLDRECHDILKNARMVPRVMSFRQMGKKSNHGLNYDEAYQTFSLINEIPEALGKLAIELYHDIYPGIRQGHKLIRRQLEKDRTLYNPFGRKRVFRDKWGDSLFKEAYAFGPQSTIVDLINLTMCDVYESNDPDLVPFELLAQVHDSLLFQFPMDHIGNFLPGLQKIRAALSRPITWKRHTFHIETDVKVGAPDLSDDLPGDSWGTMTEVATTQAMMAVINRSQ